MDISIFKMPTMRQVQHHTQQGDYALSTDLRMLVFIFLLLSIISVTMFCVAQHTLNTARFYHLG